MVLQILSDSVQRSSKTYKVMKINSAPKMYISCWWEPHLYWSVQKQSSEIVWKWSCYPVLSITVFKRGNGSPENHKGPSTWRAVMYMCLCLPPHFGHLQNYKLLHVMLIWGIRCKQLFIIQGELTSLEVKNIIHLWKNENYHESSSTRAGILSFSVTAVSPAPST